MTAAVDSDLCPSVCWCRRGHDIRWYRTTSVAVNEAHYPAGWPLPRFDRPLSDQSMEDHR